MRPTSIVKIADWIAVISLMMIAGSFIAGISAFMIMINDSANIQFDLVGKILLGVLIIGVSGITAAVILKRPNHFSRQT